MWRARELQGDCGNLWKDVVVRDGAATMSHNLRLGSSSLQTTVIKTPISLFNHELLLLRTHFDNHVSAIVNKKGSVVASMI